MPKKRHPHHKILTISHTCQLITTASHFPPLLLSSHPTLSLVASTKSGDHNISLSSKQPSSTFWLAWPYGLCDRHSNQASSKHAFRRAHPHRTHEFLSRHHRPGQQQCKEGGGDEEVSLREGRFGRNKKIAEGAK